MKLYIEKFLKRDMLIYSGIIMGVYYFVLNFAINIFTGTNMFLNLILIIGFLVGLGISVIVTAGALYYYSKKSKDMTILILGIASAIVTLLSLFGFQFAMTLFSLGTGNYLSILAGYSSMLTGIGIYGWSFYIAYLTAVYSIFLCLEMKDILHIAQIRNMYANIAPVQQANVYPQQPVQTYPVQTENNEQVVASENIQTEQPVQTYPVQTENNEQVIASENIQTEQPVAESVQPVQPNVQSTVENGQPSYNQENYAQIPVTPQKKSKKPLIIIAIIACIVVVCGGGYFVYDKFFSKTSINLVETVDVKYTGDDGNAYAKISATNDYDGDNEDVKAFLDSVYYKVKSEADIENGQLKNGQKITIIADYSPVIAEKYNVKVTSASTEVEVKGLVTQYTDASQITKDMLSKMKKDIDKKAQENLLNTTTTKQTVEFDSMYFIKSGQYSNRVLAVYKITTNTNSLAGTGSETTAKFVSYYITNPKSNYGEKEPYWFTRSLYDSDFKAVSKKENVKASLLSSYTTTEDKLQAIDMTGI